MHITTSDSLKTGVISTGGLTVVGFSSTAASAAMAAALHAGGAVGAESVAVVPAGVVSEGVVMDASDPNKLCIASQNRTDGRLWLYKHDYVENAEISPPEAHFCPMCWKYC